jgi:hypothetical protein
VVVEEGLMIVLHLRRRSGTAGTPRMPLPTQGLEAAGNDKYDDPGCTARATLHHVWACERGVASGKPTILSRGARAFEISVRASLSLMHDDERRGGERRELLACLFLQRRRRRRRNYYITILA